MALHDLGGSFLDVTEEIDSKMIKKVLKALEKKATGYDAEETTKEFATENGNEILIKKKVTKHHIPADISAAKLILDICGSQEGKSFLGLSDEELDNEAIRLFKEYQSLTDKNICEIIKGEETSADN